MSKKIAPSDANAELYFRLLKDEYLYFLTMKITQALKGKTSPRNIDAMEKKLLKEFYEVLERQGIVKKLLRKAKLIQNNETNEA